MGLLVQRVSRVLLVCIVMLLRGSYVANSAQTFEPFVNLTAIPNCLMNHSQGLSQRCFYEEKIRLKESPAGPVFSFSTNFIASIDLGPVTSRQLGYGGSEVNLLEGFTFAMIPDLNASLGSAGGYLGLLNATSNGDPQSHTFAVEFDFRNSPQFADPDDGFHIGIDVNSMNSSSWVRLLGPLDRVIGFEYNALLQTQDLRYWQFPVWIDYDASLQILNVSTTDISMLRCYLSEDQRPEPFIFRSNVIGNVSEVPYNSLSYQIDLSKVLNEHMYVGFTSSIAFSNFEAPVQQFQFLSLRTSNSTSPASSGDILACFKSPNLTFLESHPFAVKLMSILLPLTAMAVIYVLYKYYRRRVERRGWRFNIDADDLGEADPHKFTYKELAMATRNFDPKQALGRGGFGSVYKGFLPGNKQYVAVKRVAPESSQGEREFLAEVTIIGKIRHRNLVRLQGWCHERGELLLVYDYMPQGSLDQHLFKSTTTTKVLSDAHVVGNLDPVDNEEVIGFPWEKRFKIVVDVATTLVYLHTECEERIIHRDVKAANVMLDAKFNARLGDFGLARCYNHSLLTPESTNVAGTFGYFAPELFHTVVKLEWGMSRKQTEQTDVYSFGAFLLEVACGKKPIYHEDEEVKLLVEHVWQLWGNSSILDAADARLAGVYNAHEMTKVLCLGLLCSHPSPTMRPSMRQVLLILNGDVRLPEVPLSKPQFDYIPRSALQEDFSWTGTDPSSMYYTASTTREDSSRLITPDKGVLEIKLSDHSSFSRRRAGISSVDQSM